MSVKRAQYESFICIVTYGRSGSTLLQNYLNSFGDILIRGENRNILYYLCRILSIVERDTEYFSRRVNVCRPEEERESFLRSILGTPSDPWFGAENVSIERLRADVHAVFVNDFIKPNNLHKIIGFKEIRWHQDRGYFAEFMRQIENTFRNVKVVVLKRSWKDIAKSNWWRNMPSERVRDLILSADAAFDEYGASKDSWYFLDYEAMVADLDALEGVSSFIGRPFDAEVASAVLSTRLSHGK